jgi:hypothetical protein
MNTPNIHTKLVRYLTDDAVTLRMKTLREIKGEIKKNLPEINFDSDTSRLIFDTLFPEKVHKCINGKFIGFSVGYSNCKKNCECYKRQIAAAVSSSKLNVPSSRKQEISQKRKNTVNERYGVNNVFMIPETKKKASDTKLERYNDAKFRNDAKIKATNIQKYGTENPLSSDVVKEKVKETNLTKYGVENCFSSAAIRNKAKDTMIEKYGVDNPAKSIHSIEKRKNTMEERYGVHNIFQNKDFITQLTLKKREKFFNDLHQRINKVAHPLFKLDDYEGIEKLYPWRCETCKTVFEDTLYAGKIPRCPICNPKFISEFEKEVRSHLGSLESELICNSRNIISPKELDIFIPKFNLAIECNGVYWHSELQGKDKYYHLSKTIECEKKGIDLVHVWDNAWYNKKNIILSILNSRLNNNNKLFARCCHVATVSTSTKKTFMEQNHLQGDAPSSVNLGLYNGPILCAIMTFSKPRFNKEFEWELVRYVQLVNHTVVGGASKLFKYFKTYFNPKSIISYSDRSIFSGKMYSILGFNFSHYSDPGYRYFNKKIPDVLFSRIMFQKHKLEKKIVNYDPSLSEWDNMKNNNFDRIWDCGNGVWIFK